MTVLWRLPNTPIWRNIKQESHGHFVPGVMVVRIGASMYFANVAFIRDYISKMAKKVYKQDVNPETSIGAGNMRQILF